MFALLPPATFLILWRYYYLGRPGPASAGETRCWRTSFLYAAITCGLIVVAGTETLSLIRAIAFWPLAAFWTGAAAVSGVLLWRRWKRSAPADPLRLPKLPLADKLLLAPVLVIVPVIFVIAIVSPSNNWDSLVYHMARVMHWVQNRSVAFYVTTFTHQLHHCPMAEYVILHLYLLWGGDRLVNLVQWFCMAGCLIGTSLIAARLGARRRGQILAALICATIPMGILEASNAKNDYVVAFWLVCLSALILPLLNGDAGVTTEARSTQRKTPWNNSEEKKLSRGEESAHDVTAERSVLRVLSVSSVPLRGSGRGVVNEEWSREMFIGAALGLALFTKATGYLYAAPLMLMYCAARLRKFPVREEIGGLARIAALAILVNIAQYTRNTLVFGSPLYGGNVPHANASFTPLLMVSNIVRNIGMHCAGPAPWVSTAGYKAVWKIHAALGVKLEDPSTTWRDSPFLPPAGWNHEDTAGNPFHLLLAVIAICAILGTRRLRNSRPLLPYALYVVACFLLFCFCLRWQPWNSRLQLPMFVLGAPFMAVALPEGRLPWITAATAAALTLYSLGPLLRNWSRPIAAGMNIFNADRTALQFSNRNDLEIPYLDVIGYVKDRGYTKIGLYVDNDDAWEYPIWVLLGAPRPDMRLEYVEVKNPSARLDHGFDPPGPDVVICTTDKLVRNLTLDGREYKVAIEREGKLHYFLSVVVPVSR